MQCKHCDYLLFNLTQPVCPECGRAFDHERYRFEPGSVSFNCPHCDQEYYGNDRQGLPYPREFTCVRCGEAVTLRELRVVPKGDDAYGEPAGDSPWDHRRRLGLVKAWWQTLVMTLIKPGLLFRTHQGKSNMEAWLFAVISNYVGLLPYFLLQTAVMGVFGALATAGGGGRGAFPPIWLFAAMYIPLGLIGPLVFPAIQAAVNAAFIQLGLLVLAPDRKSIGHTYRVALYAQGPTALAIVPFCGVYVASIWSLVTLIIGVAEVHRITGLRAVIAVLWPLVVLFLIFVIGIALSMLLLPRAAGS